MNSFSNSSLFEATKMGEISNGSMTSLSSTHSSNQCGCHTSNLTNTHSSGELDPGFMPQTYDPIDFEDRTDNEARHAAKSSQLNQPKGTNENKILRLRVKSADQYPGSKVISNEQSVLSETTSKLLDKKPEIDQPGGVKDDKDEELIIKVDTSPDGGYGWVIVICASLVFMMYGANWVMFSVYIVDFSEVFGKPQAYIGIIGSVDATLSQITALPAGAFVSLYGSRVVCIVGLLVYAVGTGLSAFTTNFYMLLLTFGIIKGIGAGMIYIPCNMIVQQYFTRRRALAVAFSSGGLSLGTMVFSLVHRILIQTFGWRGGLLFFSAIVLQFILFAALMRPPDFDRRIRLKYRQKTTRISDTSTSCSTSCVGSAHAIVEHLRKALTLSYLRDIKFILFISIRTLGMLGGIAMYKFGVARAVFLGVDRLQASFLIASLGICSLTFRYIGGLIANSNRVNLLALYSVANCMNGLIAMLSVLASSQSYSHAIFYIPYGAFLGTGECLMPTISSDLFGVERLPSTLGWNMTFTGLLIIAYMPVFGLLFDVTGSYLASFLLGGSMQIIAGNLGFIIMCLNRRDAKHGLNRNKLNEEINTVEIASSDQKSIITKSGVRI